MSSFALTADKVKEGLTNTPQIDGRLQPVLRVLRLWQAMPAMMFMLHKFHSFATCRL